MAMILVYSAVVSLWHPQLTGGQKIGFIFRAKAKIEEVLGPCEAMPQAVGNEEAATQLTVVKSAFGFHTFYLSLQRRSLRSPTIP